MQVAQIFIFAAQQYLNEDVIGDTAIYPDEAALLQCSTCRMVTSKGVYVCPILIEYPGARMGASLEESASAFELKYAACYTCYAEGLSCKT